MVKAPKGLWVTLVFLTIASSAAAQSTPYAGAAMPIPGIIQNENFDNGGEGVAYHDTSAANEGGLYRSTGVDIAANADNTGYVVGWVSAGEWLKYSVAVAAAGSYTATFRVASLGAGGTFHLEMNGRNVTGSLTVPDTGGWQNWQSISAVVTLDGGPQVARLVMETAGLYAVGNFDWMNFTARSTAYLGSAAAIPGRVENENFDAGAEGVAYHDASAGNEGGAYRNTGVDIAADGRGGYVVGWVSPAEWLTYTVNVLTAGTYDVNFRVANIGRGGTFHLEMNGKNVTGTLTVPDTGGWLDWQTVSRPVNLESGPQIARLVMETSGLYAVGNFDRMDFAARSTPFRGTPAAIPGTIELEDFDNGGEGRAYHDGGAGNEGGAYRQTDVDIAADVSSAGYLVGWVAGTEWLNYTVDVSAAGTYTVAFRVASLGPGGKFHLEMNGANVTGALTVPDTGGWFNWQTVSKSVALNAGVQTARVVMETSGLYAVGNFDRMEFAVGTSTPPPTPTTPQPATPTPAPNPTPAAPPPGPSGVPVTGAPSTYSAISDRVVRVKPALPALGPAGYKFTDPTFGSPMLRVTDASTRSFSGLSYRSPSATPNRAWNLTSTRFYVASTDGTIIPFGFDAATMTASRLPGAGDGGLVLRFDAEPEFSCVDPDVIYSRSSAYDHGVVTQYHFATGSYSVIADVRDLVPGVDNNGRTYLRGVETGCASNLEYMSFIFGGTSQDRDRYAVWFPVGNPGARKLVDTIASTINGRPTNIPLGFYAHAVATDQSGRYVILGSTAGDIAAGKAANYVWDTLTDVFTAMRTAAGGHGAIGFGVNVNNPDDSDSTDFLIRDFTSLDTTRLLIAPLPTPRDFSAASHSSWNNSQPDRLAPVLAAMYRYGNNSGPWREWDEEIIAIRTDGAESRVWRFAHHRSDYNHNGSGDANAFWYTPRPNISPNGQWAIFTSNWEKTLGDDTRELNKRQDVFLVKLR